MSGNGEAIIQRLDPLDWLVEPGLVRVLDALEAKGGPGCVRLVGGCVRNALLKRPIADIDLATVLLPQETLQALSVAGIRALPTGLAHGTITAIVNGTPFEVTTLRRDVSTDGRRAVVGFTKDWSEDAGRRDFTLNAIYAGRDGTLFDPTGHGIADALAGKILFVGDARTRIREDYLRVLRFFRFLAWYGRGAPDATALEACAHEAAGVAILPAERTSRELLTLLSARDPRQAIHLMAETGVLGVLLPGATGITLFEALCKLEIQDWGAGDALLRLASLLPLDPDGMAGALEHLRLSNRDRDRLLALVQTEVAISAAMDAKAWRRALYRLGKQAFLDRVSLAWARTGDPAWQAPLDLANHWQAPVFPVAGADIVRLGVPKGPRVGAILRDLERIWVEGDFSDDKPALIARADLHRAEGSSE